MILRLASTLRASRRLVEQSRQCGSVPALHGVLKVAFRTVAAGGLLAAVYGTSSELADTEAAPGRLVMSGDCGGTNTRLSLFRLDPGSTAKQGEVPKGKVVYEKKYLNASNSSFEAVCQKFLLEATPYTNGDTPEACCLACAGGIHNNSVEFTNVKTGWNIDGNLLSKSLGIPLVKLINDFEAQGYGLLTLNEKEVVQLNKDTATPVLGAPMACVGAGTGLGECFLTADGGKYTCWPSEGGHAEFSPRSELTFELLAFMRDKLTTRMPERVQRAFELCDTDKDGSISLEEFKRAVQEADMLRGLRPKRISVERVVSGPGISDIYSFLRKHWAFEEFVDNKIDDEYMAAPEYKRGAIVADGYYRGKYVCRKAVEIFAECYGSEVGVAALKWLPFGGLYVSGGIAAKNPKWIQSEEFWLGFSDKGRMSPLVLSVPVFVVLVEDTGERGALFYAVQMLG